jgi:phosphate uptake regulator
MDAKLRKADEVIAQIETSTDTTIGRIRQLLTDSTVKRDDLLTRFEKVLAEAVAARDAIIDARDTEINKTQIATQIILGELAQQLGKGKLDCESCFSQSSERLTQEIEAARLRLEKEITGMRNGVKEQYDGLIQAREQFEVGVGTFIEENKGRIDELFEQMQGNLQSVKAAKYACLKVRDQLTGQGTAEKS